MEQHASENAPAASGERQQGTERTQESPRTGDGGAQPIKNVEKVVVMMTVMLLLPGLRLPVVIMPRM
jgi:hypothetical protein